MLERNSIYYDISFSTQNLTPAIAGEIPCGGFLLSRFKEFAHVSSNHTYPYIYVTHSDK